MLWISGAVPIFPIITYSVKISIADSSTGYGKFFHNQLLVLPKELRLGYCVLCMITSEMEIIIDFFAVAFDKKRSYYELR